MTVDDFNRAEDERLDALLRAEYPAWAARWDAPIERCGFSWTWSVGDGMDSESCGSSAVVGHDLDTYEPRCAEHLGEVMAQSSHGPRRREPIRICD